MLFGWSLSIRHNPKKQKNKKKEREREREREEKEKEIERRKRERGGKVGNGLEKKNRLNEVVGNNLSVLRSERKNQRERRNDDVVETSMLQLSKRERDRQTDRQTDRAYNLLCLYCKLIFSRDIMG